MWRRDCRSGLSVEIDEANSWSSQSLVPAGICQLPLEPLEPRCLPIRVSQLTTSTKSFLFPHRRIEERIHDDGGHPLPG